MHVSIRPFGNSRGIVIPKPMLAQLGLVAEPTPEPCPEPEFLRLAEVVDRHHAGDEFAKVWSSFDPLREGELVAVRHDGEDIEVDVAGENLGGLIGPRGTTLLAVQDLVRVAAQRRIGDHTTRLRLDISGYREKRQAALARFAMEQADEVASTGEERVLEPMPSADRKVIHDALSIRSDVETRSEGEDPQRRVVIAPVSSAN